MDIKEKCDLLWRDCYVAAIKSGLKDYVLIADAAVKFYKDRFDPETVKANKMANNPWMAIEKLEQASLVEIYLPNGVYGEGILLSNSLFRYTTQIDKQPIDVPFSEVKGWLFRQIIY